MYLLIPVIIIKDINFFTFLLSEEKNVQHIFICNLNLFVKLITITGILKSIRIRIRLILIVKIYDYRIIFD